MSGSTVVHLTDHAKLTAVRRVPSSSNTSAPVAPLTSSGHAPQLGGSGNNTSLRAQLRREREARRETSSASETKVAGHLPSRASEDMSHKPMHGEPLQASGAENVAPGVLDPPEAFEQSFGLEALQSAFSAKYYEFSAKYYELAKKCREWERFAAKLRAQAEALASETRLLRGLNSQQESVIERLERENIALREEAHIREADRRRLSERLAVSQARLAHSSSGGDLHGAGQGPSSGKRDVRAASALDRYQPPSPLAASSSMSMSTSIEGSGEAGLGEMTIPWCSSNLINMSHGLVEFGEQQDLRPPTPLGQLASLVDEHQSFTNVSGTFAHRDRSVSNAGSHLSGIGSDVLDAARRDADAMLADARSSWPGQGNSHVRDASRRSREGPMDQDTDSFSGRVRQPSHGPTGTHTLVNAPQSGMPNSQSAPSAIYAQQGQQPPSPGRTGKRHVSTEGSGATAPKRRSTNVGSGNFAQQTAGAVGVSASASLPSLVQHASGLALPGSGPPPTEAARRRGNSSTASDVAVTGEYLAGALEARKQLRRTSLSQQQQLQAIQAQERQTAAMADLGHGFPPMVQPPSRAGSRMSNVSTGERARSRSGRSRAGSASVHDAIPMVKDDIFSDLPAKLAAAAASRSESVMSMASTRTAGPVSHAPPVARPGSSMQRDSFPTSVSEPVALRVVSGGAQSLVHQRSADLRQQQAPRASWPDQSNGATDGRETPSPPSRPRSYEAAKQAQQQQAEQPHAPSHFAPHLQPRAPISRSTSASSGFQDASDVAISVSGSDDGRKANQPTGPQSDEDRRSAHRRLYMRLRDELDAADLVKFERYVHRYDALEIPIDGPRGLVNRVKKLLLLSDAKMRETNPERFRLRKDIAREFERIVRVDLDYE
ncbi:hypothetical protein FA09DRAFT_340791 [Tilletiopsis washingtonensis]|uniref:Uncharacterized protein n=1 Tax=Tilletiopsis washingtonensis TaxID=58919 RepID=A0A316Z449_9BASI|nr:hypothetical protein FA09DRAFT_340791 [Tilletiopsis washingtonensis]PWN95854.1 hypothetical protein FA09DRAFT_340791 [Tilletiopsis washingtonensis]